MYLCKEADRESHDLIVQHVDRLLLLYEQKSIQLLSQQSKHIEREIEHYEEEINKIIYRFYDLTNEEILELEANV
jgi:predicted phage-related endonuclease